ncbi:diaminopimelate dehydrogenase [Clostridium sp.]|uniref:diaminopimelate dehydrogenase n=1 Tax=Clostridium sp. TaxID=1506 RepID=UPI002627E5A4|nr:diaminopimelate dehydrogenase [Clostridium sp.]
MKDKIRIGVVGYGNLGKGIEFSVNQNDDFELVGIFTRRDTKVIKAKNKVLPISEVKNYKDKIDVIIVCGGSAKDLPIQTPNLIEDFNVVDSFDTHANIPEHFEKVNEVARKSGKLGLISVGWDPGLFSLNRVLGEAVLPIGQEHTFWGKGVSQGHSDAIKRVVGVKFGIQYTNPIENAIEKVRSGEVKYLDTREKHTRHCYIVPEKGADLENIEYKIKNMKNYFLDYDTTIDFITEEEFESNHKGMPHGGFVIRTGITGEDTNQKIEFNLKLDSNPEFTSNILIAYARAVYRLSNEGKTGAISILDVPISYISRKTGEELRREYL